MTSESDSDAMLEPHEMSDVMARVRQLDPTSDVAAVRGYVREMAEADALIETLDLAEGPLPVAFSPFWTHGGAR